MPSLPSAPVLGYSFTGNSTNNPTSQQPGVQLDAEFNRTNGAVAALIGAVSVSFNADGSLKSSAVQSAYAAAAPPPGGTNIADAPSAASALLSQAWAEYMPDQLPAETLAGTGITGDHWSARFWANQADQQVSNFANQVTAFTNAVTTADPANGLNGVQNFNAAIGYSAGQLVAFGGTIYRAKITIAPAAFNATQWDAITGTFVAALPLAGGTMTGPITLAANPAAALQPATKQYTDAADALALPKAGGTMTGALTLSGAPTLTLHAATKTYVDTADALALPKAGGTMTGLLTLSADPAALLGAATKQYADTKLPLAGGTLTGALTLSGAPTLTLHAATKTYVDTADALALPKAGGTLTGALTLSADPAAPLQPATKQYTDAADALALPKTGGTLTGALTLAADPAAALQPATKQYADTKLPLAGGTLTGLLTLSGNPTLANHAATKSYVDGGGVASANTGRNRLDNPLMEVQQRGAGPFTIFGYTADRWLCNSTNGPANHNIITNGSYGGRFALSASAPLIAGSTVTVSQRMAAADTFDLVGQTVTVSFWASATTTAGTLSTTLALYYATAADNFNTTTLIGTAPITVTGTPTRFNATFAGLPSTVANGLQLNVQTTQNTTTGTPTLIVGGFQLEPGSAVTPLEKRPIQQEMARCQRFYQVAQLVSAGYAVASVAVGQTVLSGVPMRANPTVTQGVNASGNVGAITFQLVVNGVFAQATVTANGSYSINIQFTLSAEL